MIFFKKNCPLSSYGIFKFKYSFTTLISFKDDNIFDLIGIFIFPVINV